MDCIKQRREPLQLCCFLFIHSFCLYYLPFILYILYDTCLLSGKDSINYNIVPCHLCFVITSTYRHLPHSSPADGGRGTAVTLKSQAKKRLRTSGQSREISICRRQDVQGRCCHPSVSRANPSQPEPTRANRSRGLSDTFQKQLCGADRSIKLTVCHSEMVRGSRSRPTAPAR